MSSGKTKNVLYISYDGMTDPLGQSQVIPYLNGLTKQGFSFTILSCEKKERYLIHKEAIGKVLAEASISWEPVMYTKKPPVLSTLYDYYKLRRKAGSLQARLNFVAVHCRSYIPSLLGQWMKKKYQVPFIFDMRGFWADERVDGGIWDLKNPIFKIIYNYFKKKETEFLNESVAVVSLTEAGEFEMLTWKGTKFLEDKISVIPCCVDTGLFDPSKISADLQLGAKRKLNIDSSNLVLGYLGSIGTWYMLDEMMLYFSILKKHVANAKFLFVTTHPAAEIQAKAQKYGINTVDIIITEAARTEVPLMISLFDYGLFFIKPSYSKMSSSPTKQGEIMAMGVPIICNSGVGDTDMIVKNYNSGLLVTDWEFDRSVQEISQHAAWDKDKIRNGALGFFSLEKGIEAYTRIYHRYL